VTTSTTPTSLLPTPIFALIDSTLPYIYLPTAACELFESAFGLVWNSTAELYLLNSTQHSALLAQNPNVTFTLGHTLSGGATVDIVLPYAAFDLNISWPHAESSTWYFPLKRAANDTQYTLGRAFLQEAYLVADYERANFSVYPCKWEEGAKADVVAIKSVDAMGNAPSDGMNFNGGKGGSHGLGGGAIAGIVIGGIVGVAIQAFGLWYLLRRRALCGRLPELATTDSLENNWPGIGLSDIRAEKVNEGEELDSSGVHELPSHHMFGVLEAPGGDQTFPKRSELDGQGAQRRGNTTEMFEMDAGPLGPLVIIVPPTTIETEAPDLPSPHLT
jgi:hypothetical protein